MKCKILALFILAFSTNTFSASLESKSDAGKFAISLAGACELMKNNGMSGSELSDSLTNQQGMDKESADLLASYSTQWLAKNPGKPCQQVYVDMIDNLESEKK
ncbi:hypothetical protein [Enterobacter oligotrophicus]|uniref:hypothetical protein n=1 Tax=Enterobacter oligotrophicus TaxID=2478464 RepID=UPI0028AB260B|nr:hypothetical protein [Enterobacter oligotrophicus]